MFEELKNIKNNRLTVYPIKFRNIWDSYETQKACFWTAQEIDFARDYDDFKKLNENEQHFIKMVLAFFAISDGIVNLNLCENFINDVEITEAKICYRFQSMMEDIHAETYSLMIEAIIKDEKEKEKIFDGINNFTCIAKKINWAQKWIESDDSFEKRLIAFAIVEGIFFSGSFCAIFWLKKKNLMHGLCHSNELISRDEAAHTDFACLLYSYVIDKLDENEVHNIFKDAVSIEKEFIIESLPCEMLGMNSKLMGEYIEYVADRLLNQLGYNKIYNTENPFDFMESISIENKTNFFEHRVSNYQLASVLNECDEKDIFNACDDF